MLILEVAAGVLLGLLVFAFIPELWHVLVWILGVVVLLAGVALALGLLGFFSWATVTSTLRDPWVFGPFNAVVALVFYGIYRLIKAQKKPPSE